ncbi:MAG: hypothetical protein ABUJ92_00770 [Desulfobacterales bacterium]
MTETKLTDAELSLKVARITRPDISWFVNNGVVFSARNGVVTDFDYTTDDALGKMCVWLAKYWLSIIDVDDNACWKMNEIPDFLVDDNPNRALAEAIVSIGEAKG